MKHFNLDKSYPLSTPMIVRRLKVETDWFRSRENDEKVLGPKGKVLGPNGT